MGKFNHIECGNTLPVNNVHAVSVSMPKLQDVIDYEEQKEEILEKIKSAYPRFVLHPYLKILAQFIKKKYSISDSYEVVLLSSQKAVEIVSSKYFIHNKIDIDEPFGVILVIKGTSQLDKVLMFIQHVGCNLSSRFAEDYLYNEGVLKSKQKEEIDLVEPEKKVIETLSQAYGIKSTNIKLAPSGMNAMYAALKGVKTIGGKNGRNILVQFGWLYLDTMNIVKHYFDKSKLFYDVENLDALEEYFENYGLQVSALVTEYPTNPLLKKMDIKRLRDLCKKYNVPLIIDSTFSTAYNEDIKEMADIYVESLTKFACGNADVLMGAIILNEKSKYTFINNEYFKHCDYVYEKDIARLAVEINGYKQRVEYSAQNTKKLVEYLKKCNYIDKIFYAVFENGSYCPVISVTFNKEFKEVYDNLNFAKGPSLGTEFTLLMPYTYLAHYNYIGNSEGEAFLNKCGLPVNLLRISVGVEKFEDIKGEFERVLKR